MVEKHFGTHYNLSVYMLVENPLNRKELFDLGRSPERTGYLGSLEPGDAWGTWNMDYIDLGFMDWYQFQWRRRFTFGLRINVN